MFHFSWIKSKAWFCCLIYLASLVLVGCGGGSDDRGDGTTRNLDPGLTQDDSDNDDNDDDDDDDTDDEPDTELTEFGFNTQLKSQSGLWQVVTMINKANFELTDFGEDGEIPFGVSASGTVKNVQLFSVESNGTIKQDLCDLKPATEVETLVLNKVFETQGLEQADEGYETFATCTNGKNYKYESLDAGQLKLTALCGSDVIAESIFTKFSDQPEFALGNLEFTLQDNENLSKTFSVCGNMSYAQLTTTYSEDLATYLGDMGITPMETAFTTSEIKIVAPYAGEDNFVQLTFSFKKAFSAGEYTVTLDPDGQTDSEVMVSLETSNSNQSYPGASGKLIIEGVAGNTANGTFNLKLQVPNGSLVGEKELDGSFYIHLDPASDNSSSSLAF